MQQRVSVDAFLYLRLFIRVSRCTMLPFRELKRRFSFPPACLVRVRFGGLNRKVCLNGMENGCVMGITLSASLNMEIHYYHLPPLLFSLAHPVGESIHCTSTRLTRSLCFLLFLRSHYRTRIQKQPANEIKLRGAKRL